MIWVQIHFNDRYEVSDYGDVRSVDGVVSRIRDGKTNLMPVNGKILKLQNDKQGYLTVTIGRKSHKVHRLVCSAFHTNPKNKRCVNHKDGDKSNNHISNLEWATHSENSIHAHRTGLKKPQQLGKSGKLHTRSIPLVSIQDTAIIEHESRNICAKYLGVHVKAVHIALNNGGNCKGHKLYSL